jgi:phosphomannomutase/phosphoglucomutase
LKLEVNTAIFREYDIRGQADEDLHDQFVVALGRAYGTMVRRSGGSKIAVGRDCRLSGVRISKQFSQGVMSTGIDVQMLGVVPTPMVYFAAHQTGIDGAVAITGSHNPPSWNGFKLCLGKSSVYGKDIRTLRDAILSEDFEVGAGEFETIDLLPRYMEATAKALRIPGRRMKVVIDAGNGTGGIAAGQMYRAMGADVEELFCEPDGHFPNHHPDPTVEANLVILRQRVLASGADLGIAFDGDADRIGAIDGKGRTVWGDQLLTIFGLDVLREYPQARIIGEVKCSKVMYETLRKAGGDVEMWKVGHSLIKARMAETNAILAGEMSGHLFFADRYLGYDDAIYAGARLIELLGNSDRNLADWIDALPETFVTPEIRVSCKDADNFEVTARAAEHFKQNYNVNQVDGVRIDFEHGWGLIRASNTQPVLVLRFEADTEARRDAYFEEVKAWLRVYAPEVDLKADTHK